MQSWSVRSVEVGTPQQYERKNSIDGWKGTGTTGIQVYQRARAGMRVRVMVEDAF